MIEQRLNRIVLLQVGLSVVVVLASWLLWSLSATLAVIAGASLATIDLALLVWLVGGLLNGARERRMIYGLGLALKFPGLIGVVYLAVRILEVDLLGFLAGISTLVISVTLAGFLLAGASETDEP